jgi:type III restriction enzyme
MTSRFFEQPILNSPYSIPTRHHVLDKDGQPVDAPPADGRRRSELITPIPRSRKQTRRTGGGQGSFKLGDPEGLSTEKQEYNPTPIINEIRQHLESWRRLPNPTDWRVTPATQQLLRHWRHHDFADVRPFFCQVEAAETVIWLTEVAQREPRYKKLWDHIKGANKDANPDLLRLALKMATGSGKTTVMAMLIAWQTVNAVRSGEQPVLQRLPHRHAGHHHSRPAARALA